VSDPVVATRCPGPVSPLVLPVEAASHNSRRSDRRKGIGGFHSGPGPQTNTHRLLCSREWQQLPLERSSLSASDKSRRRCANTEREEERKVRTNGSCLSRTLLRIRWPIKCWSRNARILIADDGRERRSEGSPINRSASLKKCVPSTRFDRGESGRIAGLHLRLVVGLAGCCD